MQGDLQLKSKGSLLAEFLLVQGTSVFGLLRPSTDWTRPTHIMVGNLISTKTTGLNVMLISILESRGITLPTKVHIVKGMFFPIVTYGCELDHKEF